MPTTRMQSADLQQVIVPELNEGDSIEIEGTAQLPGSGEVIMIESPLPESDDGQNDLVSDSDEEFLPVGTTQDYVSPEGVTYEILENCSGKGTDKLFSSEGYSYGLSKVSNSGVKTWRCTKRSHKYPCMAKVIQKDSQTLDTKGTTHCHPADPNEYFIAQITTAIKRKSVKYPDQPVSHMAKRLIEKYVPKGLEDSRTLTLERLTHMGSRHRRLSIRKQSTVTNKQARTKHVPQQRTPITVSVETNSEPKGVLNQLNSESVKIQKRKHRHKHKKMKPDKRTTVAIGALKNNEDKYECIFMPRSLLKGVLKTSASQAKFATIINPPMSVDAVISNVWNEKFAMNQARPEAPSTSTSEENAPIVGDADDMFFRSLAAEVKDLPKLAKSALKLELLSLVNAALQSQKGTDGDT